MIVNFIWYLHQSKIRHSWYLFKTSFQYMAFHDCLQVLSIAIEYINSVKLVLSDCMQGSHSEKVVTGHRQNKHNSYDYYLWNSLVFMFSRTNKIVIYKIGSRQINILYNITQKWHFDALLPSRQGMGNLLEVHVFQPLLCGSHIYMGNVKHHYDHRLPGARSAPSHQWQ